MTVITNVLCSVTAVPRSPYPTKDNSQETNESVETIVSVVNEIIQISRTVAAFQGDIQKDNTSLSSLVPKIETIKDLEVKEKLLKVFQKALTNEKSSNPSAKVALAESIADLNVDDLDPLYNRLILDAALKGSPRAQQIYGLNMVKEAHGNKSDDAEALGWLMASSRFSGSMEIQMLSAISMAALAAISTAVPDNDPYTFCQILEFTRIQESRNNLDNVPPFPLAAKYTAMVWEKYALQGSSHAMFELGCIYYEGEGIPKDVKSAMYWFRQGTKLNHKFCTKFYCDPQSQLELKSIDPSLVVSPQLSAQLTACFNMIHMADKLPGVDFKVPISLLPDIPAPKQLGRLPVPEETNNEILDMKLMFLQMFYTYGLVVGKDKAQEEKIAKELLSTPVMAKYVRCGLKAGKGDIEASVEYARLSKVLHVEDKIKDKEMCRQLIAKAATAGISTALYFHSQNQPNFSQKLVFLKQAADK
ncbi:hypothetical protein HDU76_009484, partial [Blyttiomyces sp. JEL0837]